MGMAGRRCVPKMGAGEEPPIAPFSLGSASGHALNDLLPSAQEHIALPIS